MTRFFDLMNVSSSGYYDWCKRKPSQRHLENRQLEERISYLYYRHHGYYGYRRIYYALLAQGLYSGSRERIRRRMKCLRLRAKHHRPYKVTTHSRHNFQISPNVLNRHFVATKPDEKWVGDITYIRTSHGWLYLATMIDLFSRKVVGWSMGSRIAADLVCSALEMALKRKHYPKGVLVHSDRGSQYCSKAYRQLIQKYQLTQSMSRRGNCWDNAVAESFFHSLKVERINKRVFRTKQEVRNTIFDYIEMYYNRYRLHSSIGYKSPTEYEVQYYEKLAV